LVSKTLMAKILIVDDEKAIRRSIREILEFEKHQVEEAEDGMAGLQLALKSNFDIILSDIKMPKLDGIEFLQKLIEADVTSSVIIISGHGNIDTAVDAVKKGAYDYISKPIDLNRLLVSVRNALEKGNLVQEAKVLKRKIGKGGEMIGNSEAIAHIKSLIEKVAPTDAKVLITGANGSGKELVARWLHEKSQRAEGPLVEVNCAAIPSELIESELFGHEKGSFTSAVAQRKGKFELAEGGTLFLDEVGDMSLSAQAKVLRALQENKITRVGGDKEIKVNVRIVAATNKNLEEEIEKENFRRDLFHRLNVIPIHVPSLDERRDDIPLLADYFLESICLEMGTAKKTMSNEAVLALKEKNWPGNIREFRNVIERLIILGQNEITDKDVIEFS
jgi:two-component system, NtrC family, nitrogen regulation response regulator NtrX